MQSRNPSRSLPSALRSDKPSLTARQVVLRQARKLHRAATAQLVLFAMPAAAGFMRQLCSLGWP